MAAGPWWWSERREGAVLGFTQRGHGTSTGVHRGLNLARHVQDDDERVLSNRAAVLDELSVLAGTAASSIRPVFMQQVHGARVRVVTGAEEGSGPEPCDAIVTTETDVALFALVADCTPVLLHDPGARVVAAVHAGRAGMLAAVVPAAVAAMRELGARDLEAVVGPSVCGRCYEVPEQMRSDAAAIEPVTASVTWAGTPAIDVASGLVEQLRRESVPVTWVPGCTREDESLYSYRRDGRTGRFAGVVMMTPTGRTGSDDGVRTSR